MSWDPSMATTSCRVCGHSHEAWMGNICEDCEEKVINNAEKKMGLNEFTGYLEAYDKSGGQMILKFSSPHAQYDKIAADKMRNFMDKNNVPYENDIECTLNRTIWISEKDYIKLFEEELVVKEEVYMKKYRVTEETELFHKDGFNLDIPKNTIIEGKFNGDVWEIRFNGIDYWQYNYSIEDEIEEIEKCPGCNEYKEEGLYALSRKDNKTMICDDCGTREAMEEFMKGMK